MNYQHISSLVDMASVHVDLPLIDTSLSTIFILLVMLTFFMYKWKHNQKIKPLPLPPGPKPVPLLGGLFDLVRNKPTFRWIHKIMEDMNTEIACIRLGGVHIIPVTSPEIGLEILKKQDAIFSSRPLCISADLSSFGYLSVAFAPLDDQWKKMRKILGSEVLSPTRQHLLHSKLFEEADHLVRYVYNQCKNPMIGGVVNVRSIGRHYCANMMRNMLFNKRFFGKGTKVGGPGPEEEEHVDALFTVNDSIYPLDILDYVPLLRSFDLHGQKRNLKEALKIVAKYHDPEIDERIQMWNDGLKVEEEDIIDFLICAKDKDGKPMLTAEEIKAQALDIILAIDDPPNALEWALAEMINQPKTLERATEELDKVVGRDRIVQESDLPLLNYVKACAREVFRLHPNAPFNLPHVSIADTTVAGYFIPKGSRILMSRPGLGRNPRLWDEPLKYKSERHLKNDGSEVAIADPELRLFAFSIGRRGCPAIQLGSTTIYVLFARLLQGFTWAMPPNVSSIDLSEAENGLTRAKPLVALATPRLAEHLYCVD